MYIPALLVLVSASAPDVRLAQAEIPEQTEAATSSVPTEAPVVPGLSAPAPAEPPPPDIKRVGLQLDLGVLDILGLSVAYRPLYWIRLHGGVTYNAISPGLRVGVSLVPFNFFITPTLTLEAGRYFPGNANLIVQKITGNSSFDNPLLRNFGYDFANAHLGLELGPLFIRAGISYLRSTIGNFQAILSGISPTLTSADPNIRATHPSVKIGLLLYFW